MVREGQTPGGLTVLYGLWPFDNPPLLQFRPTVLLVDILCGSLLTGLATIIPVYWLRVRGRPAQFTLRGVLGLITVVACLERLKVYGAASSRVGLDLELVACLPFMLLLYGVPACLVVVAAHRAVSRSASSTRRRRWLGVHWLTWLSVLAVGGPLLHYALRAFAGWFVMDDVVREIDAYGWPMTYAHVGFSPEYFSAIALITDVALWLATTVATGYVVERWIRRVEQRIPMRSTAIFSGMLVAGVVLWVVGNDKSWRPPRHDYLSWLLGMAAVAYAAELLVAEPLLSPPESARQNQLSRGALRGHLVLARHSAAAGPRRPHKRVILTRRSVCRISDRRRLSPGDPS